MSVELLTQKSFRNERIYNEITPISEIQAIIPCGGGGTRLREVTNGTPKQLLPLQATKRIIDFPLNIFRAAGIRNISIITSNTAIPGLGKHVPEHQDNISYMVESKPSGVLPAIAGFVRDQNIQVPIIKADGDEVICGKLDIAPMYYNHMINKHGITVLCTTDPQAQYYRNFDLDAVGKVTQIHRPTDGPTTQGYHTTGLWIMSPEYFPYLSRFTKGHELYDFALSQGWLYGYLVDTQVVNINTPTDLLRARYLVS
jgi:NDP-sugar pyrophosphorylase family protein